MKPDTFKVVQMAVRDGIAIGVRRARKHIDNPTDDELIDIIEREVMTQLCEWFRFEEDEQ
jgi:hypothetical protein